MRPAPAPPRTLRRAVRDAALVLAALGLCPLAAHAWLAARPTLLALALFAYMWVHLPATVGALVWAWLERPARFALARDAFLATQGVVVTGYLLLPTAPPRLVPGLPFGDTLAFWGAGTEAAAQAVQSPYAAIPSGHVAFAVVAAGVVVALARPLLVRALACAYPPLVAAITLATGNHFWLDAVAGLAVAAAGGGLAVAGHRLAERRPARRPRLAPAEQPASARP